MYIKRSLFLLLLTAAHQVFAWGNHTPPSYRALENMPEVANALPVKVESLEAFLKAEEKGIEALMAKQEIWARANVDSYAARPAALDYQANSNYTDAERRLAFFKALRIAQNSRFALYIHHDARTGEIIAPLLPYAAGRLGCC